MGICRASVHRSFVCLFALFAASRALADEAPVASESQVDAPPPAAAAATPESVAAPAPVADTTAAAPAYPPPAPAFASGRPAMTREDWEKKIEGPYYTGLPLVNSDPDTGVGYGVRVFRFDNGERSNALFPYRAFDTRLYAQYFATTGGAQYHEVALDAPFFLDGPHRLKLNAVFDRNIAANWFGGGEFARSADALKDPVTGQRFDEMSAYLDSMRQVRNGTTYAFYNKFEIERPTLNGSWEELLDGGRLRLIAGLSLQHVRIRDAEGSSVKGLQGTNEVDATQGSTLLGEQCASGKLVGCGGGFNNMVKLSVSYDMRDFEPDPNSGYVLEASTQFGGTATGSADNYVKGAAQVRGFWSPFPEVADLVLAGRALYAVAGGDVPFYSLTAITLPDGDIEGLGGRTTIRGFKQSRFVGRVYALANVELRWQFVDFRAIGQRFGLMLCPFADAGRSFDRVADTTFAGLKTSAGAGFRIAWNQATIINVDYGRSQEGAGLYINFGHPF
jgi:outer membrane protein assembly factor BamA